MIKKIILSSQLAPIFNFKMYLNKIYYLILFFLIFVPVKSFCNTIYKNFENFFLLNISNDILTVDTKIGVVDFRNILKESKTMKKLGKEFLKFDKLLNTKIKKKQLYLQNEQKKLIDNKNNFNEKKYDELKIKLKKKITEFQKFSFSEKKKLKSSFERIKRKLEDILASTIKTISKEKGIDLIILKENIFLFNKTDLDLTNEALLVFDEKTSNLKITLINKNR